VTLALGVHGATSIRVGELPGHWFVDVRALPIRWSQASGLPPRKRAVCAAGWVMRTSLVRRP